ncbi:MAG: AbrB/MazE/SpoVT family DNA-binding domain-containing protein [Candidatus Woesearchaeota archaeon]
MVKLQMSQNRYFITVPAKVVNLLRWQKGDVIDLESDLKGRLYLEKKKPEV